MLIWGRVVHLYVYKVMPDSYHQQYDLGQAAARPSADELRKHVEAAGSGNGGDGGGAQGGPVRWTWESWWTQGPCWSFQESGALT